MKAIKKKWVVSYLPIFLWVSVSLLFAVASFSVSFILKTEQIHQTSHHLPLFDILYLPPVQQIPDRAGPSDVPPLPPLSHSTSSALSTDLQPPPETLPTARRRDVLSDGRVLSEFLDRILSRPGTWSVAAASPIDGAAVLSAAAAQGHRTHSLHRSTPALLTRMLLAYLEGEAGDAAVSHVVKNHAEYIVVRVGPVARPVEKIPGYAAVRRLLRKTTNYRVSILAASHFFHITANFQVETIKELDMLFKRIFKRISRENDTAPLEFLMYATRGLDTAITSRIARFGLGSICLPCISEGTLPTSGMVKECPLRHGSLMEQVKKGQSWKESSFGNTVYGHSEIHHAEWKCVSKESAVKFVSKNPDSARGQLACATQIVKREEGNPLLHVSRPDILVLDITPMSRAHLKRELPLTAAALDKLGFVSFGNYTAAEDVGDLYSGGSKGDSATRKWLWDRLRDEAGYVTYAAQDGCPRSHDWIYPNTTHGSQLTEMFCRRRADHQNCVGGTRAAQHLLQHADQFMRTYTGDDMSTGGGETVPKNRKKRPGKGKKKMGRRPFAAFLSFVDADEDSMALVSALDDTFSMFLNATSKRTNLAIFFLSAHGMERGAYSRMSPGRREAGEPVLAIRLPKEERQVKNLRERAMGRTIAQDVHATLLNIGIGWKAGTRTAVGRSLLKLSKAEEARPGQGGKKRVGLGAAPETCQRAPLPPSTASFFSDIPRDRRPSWPICNETYPVKPSVMCQCATNIRDWFPCFHDVPFTGEANHEEMYALKSCPDEPVEVNVHLERKGGLADRWESTKLLPEGSLEVIETPLPPPSILFLEIDSVSMASADRHFPKTVALLKKYSSCTGDGPCSVIFNGTSVVGQNSIPNQLASLTGCSMEKIKGSVAVSTPTETVWCPPGYNGNSNLTSIFDHAKDRKYITLFGEEFCETKSPYVVQHNYFPLDVDISLTPLFCHLASDIKRRRNLKKDAELHTVEFGSAEYPKPCVKGRQRSDLPLEYLRGLWDLHPLVPKFAFVNAAAAHWFPPNEALRYVKAEAYDESIVSFLQGMLEDHSTNTIFVVRSDHGAQWGRAPLEHHAQVEHARPWNNIIIPGKFANQILIANADALVTGFDLHRTLMGVMGQSSDKNLAASPWSIDLLSSVVPQERTCQEANVPRGFCPCMNERIDMAPLNKIGEFLEGADAKKKKANDEKNRLPRNKIIIPGNFANLIKTANDAIVAPIYKKNRDEMVKKPLKKIKKRREIPKIGERVKKPLKKKRKMNVKR